MTDAPKPTKKTILHPLIGLLQSDGMAKTGWEDLKDRPLQQVAWKVPFPLPSFTQQSAAFDPSYEATVRALGATPLKDLTTENIIMVTTGLLHNLRHQPGPHDKENAALINMIWDQHVREIAANPRKFTSTREEISTLGESLGKLVPRNHSQGRVDELLVPLEWETKNSLQNISTNVDFLMSRVATHSSDFGAQESSLLKWAKVVFKDLPIKKTYHEEFQASQFEIKLKPGTRNTSEIERQLKYYGALDVQRTARFLKIVPNVDSPLESALNTLTKNNMLGGRNI